MLSSCDVLKGIFPLSFQKLCIHMHMNLKTKIKVQVSRVTSHDLRWENKTYTPKRSITKIVSVLPGEVSSNKERCSLAEVVITKLIRVAFCYPE